MPALLHSHANPSTTPTDEELATALKNGDGDAFDQLFHRWRGRIYGYSLRMLGRPEVAEEICTDVFCRVLECRWQPTGSFRSYLFGIAHRRCLMHLRQARVARRNQQWVKAAAPVVDPEQHVLRHDRTERLMRAIECLAEDQRTLLLLYYGQDMSSREVAEVLGCSDQQIRSRLSYSRRKLREVLLRDEEVR